MSSGNTFVVNTSGKSSQVVACISCVVVHIESGSLSLVLHTKVQKI